MIYYKEEKKKLVIPSGFVMIPIDCDEAIEQAREQGYQEGFADGSSATCDTEEGTYSLTDDFDGEETVFPSEGKTGFNKIVIVDDGYGDAKYNEGYADGIADCSGSTPCDCSSAITEAYESGVTEGIAEQKSLLVSSAFTRNGTYTRENGWNEIEVNVPQWLPAEEKTLSLVRNVSGPWEVLADSPIGMSKVTVEDNGYGSWKYDQGYQAGIAQCSGGTSCSLQDDYELYLDGSETAGQMPIWPSEGYDGISEGRVFYMEAYQNQWNSGHTSGFTDGYQSGYTQGQADCDCTESYEIGYQDGYADGRESIASGCPMQEKFIRVSTIEESVTPDYGYAGLSGVHINAENFYNTAYNDGYAAGLEDCSGSTDCSSAITEAYQSGYTEGYTQGQADCPECSGGTCNLESGQVSLGYDWTGFTRVYPSQGYDGLSDVIVADLGYGQRKFDEGYTEGHTSGYTEGYNEAITTNCGSAITEAYESGYTEGYDAAGTKIYSSSKDVYFDELTWVDVEDSAAYSEEDTIMIDYKWGNTVTGSNTIVLFSNESDDPTAANPPSPTTPSFSILMHTAGLSITTDDGQGNRQIWTGLNRSAQLNHSYRLIVQTYSYTSSVTIKAALIDLTSGQITTGSTNGAFHFTGATSLSYCINGYRNTVDGVYEGMNSDWYLGGIKIFDNTGRMKHNYHFLNGCISDVVNDLETGYEAKYYDNSVETYYPLTGVEETMRFFY